MSAVRQKRTFRREVGKFGFVRSSEIKLCGTGELGLCFINLARISPSV